MIPIDNIISRTAELHSTFKGMRIFIAGNGFFARWFVDYFDHLNVCDSVICYSRKDDFYIEAPETYNDAVLKADCIINCAGAASGGTDFEMLNVHGFGPVNLFSQMQIGAKGLQISTGAVNGDTSYARAKRLAELGIGLLGRDVQIVRPFATIGPGMNLDAHFAISSFIRRKLASQPLEVSDTPCYRSFTHIADLMVQMLYVLAKGDGKPYDVGSDNVISIMDAARAISDNVRIVNAAFVSNAASPFYVTDLSRIRNQFGFELDWSSEEAIRDTLKYYERVNR